MEPEKDIFEKWDGERESNSWIRNKLESIPLWWEQDGRYMYRNFKIGVVNIVYWFPIIWKDRNWDSHYIFEILKHKLKAHANYIADEDRHTRAQHDARNMRLCVKLMQLIQDEFYDSEYLDYFDYDGLLEENFDGYFAKYPLIHKRVLNGEGVFNREGRENNKQIIAMNIGNINQTRAHKLLFKIMEDNILGWWD